MDSRQAYLMGYANRDKEEMVFDWDAAARIIKERNVDHAEAGLRNDWENTGGIILENGKPVMNSYTYLASTWAVPEIMIDGMYIECYRMQSDVPKWGAKTKWPKSSLEILAN